MREKCHGFRTVDILFEKVEKKYNPSFFSWFLWDLTAERNYTTSLISNARAFGLHASRRLSPWFWFLPSGSVLGPWSLLVSPVGHSSTPRSPASVTWRHPARSPPFRYVWLFLSFRVSCGLRICPGARVPYVHNPTCWWRLGPRPVSLLKAESSRNPPGSRHNWEVCLLLPPLLHGPCGGLNLVAVMDTASAPSLQLKEKP